MSQVTVPSEDGGGGEPVSALARRNGRDHFIVQPRVGKAEPLPAGGAPRKDLAHVAVGSLLRHATKRKLDAVLGEPSILDARTVVELELSLRLAPPRAASPHDGGGGGRAAGKKHKVAP